MSNEQKKLLKRGVLLSVVMAIIIAIINPLITGETLTMPDTLIRFLVNVGVYLLVYSLFVVLPKK